MLQGFELEQAERQNQINNQPQGQASTAIEGKDFSC
jgi:hypothetical protein